MEENKVEYGRNGIQAIVVLMKQDTRKKVWISIIILCGDERGESW